MQSRNSIQPVRVQRIRPEEQRTARPARPNAPYKVDQQSASVNSGNDPACIQNLTLTFETASRYDESLGDAERVFRRYRGRCKYQVLERCFGGTMGGIVGLQKSVD